MVGSVNTAAKLIDGTVVRVRHVVDEEAHVALPTATGRGREAFTDQLVNVISNGSKPRTAGPGP